MKDDRDLLFTDICARLKYNVKAKYRCFHIHSVQGLTSGGLVILCDEVGKLITTNIENIQLYLFPLSSMTEEQIEELKDEISKQTEILIERMKNDDCGIDCGKYHFHSILELEWLLKNHFDFRDLIEKGLAVDATGKDIY